MANYPGAIPALDPQSDGVSIVNADDVNLAYDEITAIAQELGANASVRSTTWNSVSYNTSITDFGTVGARIKNVEDGVQTITGSAVTSTGNKTITVTSDANVSLTLKAKSGQTGNLLETKDSSDSVVTAINSSGYIVAIDGGSA